MRGRASRTAPLLIACIVLAIGLSVSYALSRHAEGNFARETRTRFDAGSSLALAGIQNRIDDFQAVLLGMQGLFIASERVDRREFQRYYHNLHGQLRLPGIRALHFTRRVSDSEKAAFVAAVRHDRSVVEQGFPDFAIHPESSRAEHFVIEYIEPFDTNRRAFGLDAASQPVNLKSFLAARDTGGISFTAPFQLIQASPGEIGMVLRAPVYRYGVQLESIVQRRSAFVGLIGISLNASEIFNDIFAEPFLAGHCVVVNDVDSGGSGANPAPRLQLIAKNCVDEPGVGDPGIGLTSTTIIPAGGRLWEVRVSARDDWLARQQGSQTPTLILVAGSAISLLLAALYLALARSRIKAQQLAARMTRDLRHSERRFRAMAEMSTDWFWEQDSEGRFVSIVGAGPAGGNKMPLPLEEIKGKTRWELFPSALTPEQWESHRRQILAREPFELEYPMRDTEGKERWLKTFGTPRYDDDGVFLGYHGTSHDVTVRKQAEFEMGRKTTVLQATLDNMAQGISVVDANLVMIALNRKFCEILDFPPEMGHEGATFESFIRYNAERGEYGPCDIEAKVNEMMERARHAQAHRFKRTRPNGRIVEVVGNPLPDGGFVTTYTDITEQELAAQAIRDSEARLRRAELAAKSGNWELHLDSQLMIASEGAAKLYGIDRSELAYADVKAIPLPEYRRVLNATLKDLIENNRPYDVEFKIKTVDTGETRDIHSMAQFDRDSRTVFGVIQDITERKQAEETLLHSEERFSKAFHSSPLMVSIARAGDGRFIDANRNYERDFGWKREELIGRTALEAGLWPDEETRRPWAAKLISDGRVVNWETLWRHRNGELRWVSISAETVDMNGEQCVLAFVMDITERKQAAEKLQLAASVFTHAREGITITDANGAIVEVNDTFTEITGYSREEALGKNPRILKSGRQEPEFYAALWHALTTSGHWSGEIWNRRRNGEIYAQMLTISAVRDVAGTTRNYVALFTDITATKEHQQKLEHIAHYDALTGLPNRVLLADRLHLAMAQSQRRQQSLAVVYLDLDGFKPVNDQHGHEVGDELLIVVSQRLKAVLREGDTLGRLGGDEFVAVLVDLEQPQDCEPVLARLLLAAAAPATIGALVLHVSASIGVTLYPQDESDADQLLRHADQAMYQAKQTGKNRYHLFDLVQDAAVRSQRESVEHIRHALDQQQFVLHYQPKVNMRSGVVIGAEALIRWQHPERGLLPPADFLPITENHPIGIELGEWVIGMALAQMSRWRDAGLDIPLSVNVGARQLQQGDFVSRLGELLAVHPDLPPGSLELEVLETNALDDVVQVSAIMHACRAIGVRFALDDFGTGYSSLTYLKRLPADLLKIDQSFVRTMRDDPDDLAIVEGVIGLATAFRRQIIAEGVETVAHGELLLILGCELAQGYGIARPMPAADLPGWMSTWRPDAAWTAKSGGTVNRGDLAVVFAEVEHRHWVRNMELFLAGERDSPLSLDPHQCRFGRWLDTDSQARYGHHPAFSPMIAAHERVHALGRELVDMHSQGRRADAQARLEELHHERDELIAMLRSLARDGDAR
ncbi:MAG: EAL domain-containing protein [Rhodocyclales bacterium]|nr:EAL domain-containing protein [Rhodocyclales bacterium]